MQKRSKAPSADTGEAAGKELVSFHQLLLIGTVIRFFVLAYSIFHDSHFRVKYTDIDYMIVVDGAKEMLRGGSPFDRTTYRYTPLLAVLAIPAATLWHPLAKVIFTMSDIGAARYCYQYLQTYATPRSAKWMVSVFIIFNPVVLNVSTRGNSDMLITYMSMGVLAKFSERRYALAALILGFAVHFKIYPIMYALPLVLGIWMNETGTMVRRFGSTLAKSVACGVCFLVGFGVPTALCYAAYGYQYLYEAFIYHIHREDHRHNFSPYWMLMYLNMGRRKLEPQGVDYAPGLVAFLPQVVVLFFVSWRLRRNVAQACCIQTILFIAFNKVCTVQYFVWFLPFLPFIFCETKSEALAAAHGKGNELATRRYRRPSLFKILLVLGAWVLTIPLWVLTAYPLEFKGENQFGRLWMVCCVFFMSTIALTAWLGNVCRHSQMQAAKDAAVAKRD